MKKLLFLIMFSTLGFGVSAQSLADAQKAIEVEQFEKARGILEKLAQSNPNDGQYEFYLGNVYLLKGEDALARAAFERGLAAPKNAQINNIGIGRLLLDAGEPDQAAAEFEKALYRIKKRDTEKYINIARAYYSSYNPDYAKATMYASRALEVNPNLAEGYLILGEAEYKLGNLNEAYVAYRNVSELDESMLRSKLNLAIITKDAQAYDEAVTKIEEIIAINPDYGPAYRELAEIYYLWGSTDRDIYDEYIKKALRYYEKYMELTDYSLDSRMRHADFLVLAKDYEALEKEATIMQTIDNVNPRIFRYKGYSAFENKNYREAIEALTTFMKSVEQRRILGIDYAYLARAELRLMEADGITPVDEARLSRILSLLATAIEMGAPIEDDFSELGINYYKAREYGSAAKVFETLINTSQPSLINALYFANSVFYDVANLEEDVRLTRLADINKADSIFAFVIRQAPGTLDPYFNRARLNRFIPGAEAKVAALMQAYIDAVNEKGPAELENALTRRKVSEAYTEIGVFYADTDVEKAIASFQRALELDEQNEHAAQSLKFLQQ